MLRTKTLTEDAEARMIREARLMAKLSHPNVVAVYDVDLEHTRRVVIAMELVDGETLEDWLRAERSWTEVLGRFVLAGRGLAAAHEAGILHRDFKPANVLVGRGEGRVLVTDFGLARTPEAHSVPPSVDGVAASGSDSGMQPGSGSIRIPDDERTDLTKAGVVMGTPKYMSPEQHRGDELSAASDQYSFCVSLWLGLTGAQPFEGAIEALSDAKHRGPPAWPKHAAVPRRTVEAIRRGLSPEPAQRWPSMLALLEALQPARRSSRWWVLGAGAGAATLGVALWGTQAEPAKTCTGAAALAEEVWSTEQSTRAQAAFAQTALPYAEASWEGASARLDEYMDAWTGAYTEACEATTVRGERSPQTMDLQMGCLERSRRAVAGTIEVLVSADAGVVDKAERIVGSLPSLDRCVNLESLLAEVPPPSSAEDAAGVEAAEDALARAKPLTIAGRMEEVAALLAKAEEAMQGIDYAPTQVKIDMVHAVLLDASGKFTEAVAAFERTMQAAFAARQWRVASQAAAAIVTVAGARLAQYDKAYAYAGFARAMIPLTDNPIELEVAVHNNIAITYELHGRLDEAEAEHRRGLARTLAEYGPNDPRTGKFRNNLGLVLEVQERYAEAKEQYDEALKVWQEPYGPLHPVVVLIQGNVANLSFKQGRFEEALALQQAVLKTRIEIMGEEHPEVALARANLGNTYAMLERFEDAEVEIRKAWTSMRAAYGDAHPDTLTAVNTLGQILTATDRAGEAVTVLEEAANALEVALADQAGAHPLLARLRVNLADALKADGRPQDAQAQLRRALVEWEGAHGKADPSLGKRRLQLAKWRIEAGDTEEALEILERARKDLAPVAADNDEAAEVLTAIDEAYGKHRAFPPPG